MRYDENLLFITSSCTFVIYSVRRSRNDKINSYKLKFFIQVPFLFCRLYISNGALLASGKNSLFLVKLGLAATLEEVCFGSAALAIDNPWGDDIPGKLSPIGNFKVV